MKLALAALAAVFTYVQADMPSDEDIKELGLDPEQTAQADDMLLTDHQYNCFFVKGAPNCTAEDTRTGFDTHVTPWTQYFNSRRQKYVIPMKVNSRSYPSRLLPTLWNSLNWAKNHFAEHTAIELQFVDDHETGLYFSDGFLAPRYIKDCWSFVGDITRYNKAQYNKRTGQQMDFGWCHARPGSIVHEVMHALGFVHEHSRPDRDDYLYNVRDRNVNCQKYVPGRLDLSGLAYDFGSIMHYPSGKCGGMRVRRQYGRKSIGQRTALSANDIRGINDIYNKNGPKFARG